MGNRLRIEPLEAIAILLFLICVGLVLCFTLTPDDPKNSDNPLAKTTDNKGSIGIGAWIYEFDKAEGGDPEAIVAKVKAIGLDHIIVCYARGGSLEDYAERKHKLFRLCKENGIKAFAYERCQAKHPEAEAKRLIESLDHGAYGCVVDMEEEYEGANGEAMAKSVLSLVCACRNKYYPNAPIVLSGFGLRSYHGKFPWSVTDKYCDQTWPQWYQRSWRKTQGWSLDKSLKLIAKDKASYPLPCVPTLQAYGSDSGFEYVSPEELNRMLHAVDTTNGVNIFRWELMDDAHWEVVRKFAQEHSRLD